MKKIKLNKLNILLCLIGIFSLFFISNVNQVEVHALDTTNAITFDVAKGNIILTNDTYSGYDSTGNAVTGTHEDEKVYIITQSNPSKATTNYITVTCSTKNYIIVLDGVNIRRGSNSNSSGRLCAMNVNPSGEAQVHLILKDGSKNYLYSGENRAGLEKESRSTGLLLITCESGYNEWLKNPNTGHNDSSNNNSSLCDDHGCGYIDARSGNAWKNVSDNNVYVAGAGIGTCGNGSGAKNIEGSLQGTNALDNLTIAGGKIMALGGRGQTIGGSSGGGANIGVGSASSSSARAGSITNFKITGGYFDLLRGDNSASCIGGGYRSGYVSLDIYGGTILCSDDIDPNAKTITKDTDPTTYRSTITSTKRARAACIGGGGGGTNSESPSGATLNIYNGVISATNRYGAAIGSGAGGDGGSGQSSKINIFDGNITAITKKGDGNGAGAGIGAGGSLKNGSGGDTTVVINGGSIFASSDLGADIGGGGTRGENSNNNGGVGNVTINGGKIKTTIGGIGGGKANAGVGGNATVIVNDGEIESTSIGGGISVSQDGGIATVTVNGGKMICSSIIGGGNSTISNGGSVTVTVNAGYLESYSIGGGTGGTSGNGGSAEIYINGGKIVTGTIGGGNTNNSNGSIGFAKAVITGGEITGQFIMAKGANEPCTFTMSGGILHGLDTSETSFPYKNGGAVYMDDPSGVAVLSGGTITGGSATLGGAVYMTAGEFTVSNNGIIQGNNATENGGAIYLGKTGEYKGTFTINGGTITGNTAAIHGGAIYLDGGDAYVNGGEIKLNNSVNGGGAYLAGGTLTVTDGSINENTASSNGGGAYLAGGTLTISGGSISSNIADNGAGAYLADGTLTASGGSIKLNDATTNGGGAYLKGGKLIVSGGNIESNTAIYGAGAYLEGGALEMSNGYIKLNTASTSGGGAYLAGGSLTTSGGSIESNEATSNGGGAYLAGGKLIVSGGNIESNKAVYGAGAYLEGGTLEMSAGNISSNIASLNGGGAYLAGGTLTITGGSISSNTAENGAGAYVNNGTIDMSAGDISLNTATNGGGAYVNAGALNISGGSINLNKANDGAGAYVNGGNIAMTGGDFTNNTAENDGGGAFISGGDLVVTSGSFVSNNANKNGGGAYLEGGNFELNGLNASFIGNASTNGGGVYLTGGEPNLYEGSLKGNFAKENGAGIYIDRQNVVLKPKAKVEIINNKAGYDKNGEIVSGTYNGNGGAIYISGTNGTDASFSVDISSTGTVLIDNNIAKTNGGGICINNGYFDMNSDKATVTNNKAENGGGVAVLAGNFNISAGSIGAEGNANKAENGGGVYVSGGNVLIYGTGEIKNNEANSNGGGVCVANGNVTMIGGTVGSNKAITGDGGGIYASAENQNVTVEILSGNITNNSAYKSGGAFAVVGRTGGTEDITVTLGVNEQHLDENGNRVECKHGNESIHTTTCPVITFNTAQVSGGAIYITGGKSTKLNLYCLEEANNKAEDGESRSNFMMVDGGTILLSTVENKDPSKPSIDGLCSINNSIHVTAGAMDLYGSMSNPKIEAPITVDITSTEDYYRDHRTDDDSYYKLQYYENFKNNEGITTGQYTVYQIKKGTSHTISGVIYNHPGYEIIGWFTEPDGDGTKYEVGKSYLFNGNPIGDLIIYAIWQAHSYFVEFNANVPSGTSYSGTMEKLQFNYNNQYTLPLNEYFYVGHIFLRWEDADGNTYTDGQTVENLTAVDGKTIILYAQWSVCEHNIEEFYHYFGEGNVITKECNCLDYFETATLVTLNTVYTGDPQLARVEYSDNKIDWGLNISYKLGEENVISPVNAGTYNASITYMGATASGIHFIDKATQEAPDKPTYKVEAKNDVYNTIIIEEKFVENKTFEYTIEWYEGTTLCTHDWVKENIFTLEIAYTNYYIFARYAGDENHYPSERVRADAVYYFLGLASIKVLCPDTIHFVLTQVDDSLDANGIKIEVNAVEGYFLTKDFSVTPETFDKDGHIVSEGIKANIQINDIRKEYLLVSIPSEGEVVITIDGAKIVATINSYVADNQVFEDITSTNANITNDSSFTTQFELSNVGDYSDYAIKFNKELPINTSIILVDCINNIYYYKNLTVSLDTIKFSEMTELFKFDNDAELSSDNENKTFRVIVDFSKVDNGYLSDDLSISLAASKNPEEPCLPDFPKNNASIILSGISHSLEETISEAVIPLTKEISFSYANTNASASKWENRAPSLIVTPLSILPIDARLEVKEGIYTTVYYLNSDNKFIIPLIENAGDVSINLVSDMFGKEELKFDFKVELVASNSISGELSSNGTVLQTIEKITFVKPLEEEVALSVETDKTAYNLNSNAEVTINYLHVNSNMTVTLTLMLKDDKGEYSSTGWNKTITSAGKITVPLAGQVAGSYSLTCVIKDETGITLVSVPCYFVITSQDSRPSVTLSMNKESYVENDEVIATIISNNITDNEIITLSLLILDETNNTYSATGWSEEITDQRTVSIIPSNWQNGTYKLLCEVKSVDGGTVSTSETYFEMSIEATNPSA